MRRRDSITNKNKPFWIRKLGNVTNNHAEFWEDHVSVTQNEEHFQSIGAARWSVCRTSD